LPNEPVVMDGKILTGKGPAAAMVLSIDRLGNLKAMKLPQSVADGLGCAQLALPRLPYF